MESKINKNWGKINVTQPILPPLEELIELLKEIWETKWLTNNGKYHRVLEKELAEFLGVPYVSLFANGTLALVTALQCLRVTAEVITTPYSFVATTHSLNWNGIKPIFVDIDEKTCTLNPEKIEAAITPKTTAILPVHVYGNPCKVDEIEKIADVYGLKVIYDAAHAFGVEYNGQSVLNYGDLSILSFHATKVFNTFEGGAIVCHDEKTKKRIDFLKNFGFADEVTVVGPGINAKMNEFQAALGLLQLKYFNEAIEKRKQLYHFYKKELIGIKGIVMMEEIENLKSNYAYFPIFVTGAYGKSRDQLYEQLRNLGYYCRRYFYPLISQFPTYRGLPSADPENLPVASNKTEQVLCLPIYPDLSMQDANSICSIIKEFQMKI